MSVQRVSQSGSLGMNASHKMTSLRATSSYKNLDVIKNERKVTEMSVMEKRVFDAFKISFIHDSPWHQSY